MLTRAAFRFHRLVLVLVAFLMGFGAWSYFSLPAQEDPAITIREAVVTTAYPGLAPERVEALVTKPLEHAIRRMPEVEEIRSSSMQGLSIIHVEVHDRFFELDQIWDDLRAEVGRAAALLPEGAGLPVVADDVGDVAVVTIALRSPDHAPAEMGEMATHVRDRLYAEPGVKSVEIVGRQPERITIEAGDARLAGLGLSPDAIAGALAAQNIIRPGGGIDLGSRALLIEPTGDYRSVEAIGETLIPVPGRDGSGGGTVPLRDVADDHPHPRRPPAPGRLLRGRPGRRARGGDAGGAATCSTSGRASPSAWRPSRPGCRWATRSTRSPSRRTQVERAVHGVTINVLQTLAIVLLVVVLLLGLRTGLIVGAIVPVVMLSTLAVMGFLGLPLERMSLATLVIALGLLVDAGVVVAEDFKARLVNGEGRDDGARGRGHGAVAAAAVVDRDHRARVPAADAGRARGGRVYALNLDRDRHHALDLLADGDDGHAAARAPLRRRAPRGTRPLLRAHVRARSRAATAGSWARS